MPMMRLHMSAAIASTGNYVPTPRHSSRWRVFLLTRLTLSPGDRVLDMATGTGALAVRLARRDGLRVTGADITRPMLLQTAARSDGRLRLVEGTAEAAPVADGGFGAV